MSDPILSLSSLQSPVFLVNSRLSHFSAAPSCSTRKRFTLPGRPFSRSYGTILPSSLTRVIPRVLEFSSRLPVSVYGTGADLLTRGFSWQREIRYFALRAPRHSSTLCAGRICQPDGLAACPCTSSRTVTLSFCVPPSFRRWYGGTGISTCCPSPTPFGLGLGPD